jgi:ATP-dependent DNA helicase Q4
MKVLQCFFGFSCFRAAQSWAVDRCNMGLNSLLVMPTGAGKSICYQIPAIIQDGLTIVVSPLIALMQDQIKKLPLTLPGACLSGDLTTQEVARISSLVIDGMIKVLFVSPERLCTPSFRFLMKNLQTRHATMGNTTHAVSLLCVDEAHCLSSWSYNFRPAFLRITRELPFINPGAILALTATAPPYIQTDIMSHLKIPSEGVNAAPYRRDNVRLHAFIAMNEEHRRSIVMALLDSSKRVDKRDSSGIKVPSTIIYVWRRADAENMSEFLKSSGINAIAYHAGMDSDARKRAQQMFDRGSANVIAVYHNHILFFLDDKRDLMVVCVFIRQQHPSAWV